MNPQGGGHDEAGDGDAVCDFLEKTASTAEGRAGNVLAAVAGRIVRSNEWNTMSNC